MACTSIDGKPTDENKRVVTEEDIIFSAITSESLGTFRKICQKLCVNFRLAVDLYGRNALHVAASCGKQDIVEWLVKEQRIDIDATDLESNWTALHRSLFYGYIRCAIKLLQLGADPSLCDNEDLTPLNLVMLDCPYKLLNAGLSWSKYKSEVDLESQIITDRLEVYTWGLNSNFTLGHGDESSRKNPELLEAISCYKQISIVEVVMCKFHSVFLTSDGKVFTCGHGQGGRLGHGNEETLLVPRKIKELSGYGKCIAVASAQDHTVLLTEDGEVFTFGLNDHHQLGHSPPPAKCLVPKQVFHKSLKDRKMIGIAAGRYHTVMYTRHEVYTCGLNVGQLGHPKGEKTQITPRQVSSLHLKNIAIHSVASCDTATVCATKTGDIYLLSQFTCRKIIKRFSGLRSLKLTDGELQLKNAKNTTNHDIHKVQVILLNTKGQVYQWRESFTIVKRCKWLLRRSLNVTSIAVGRQLMISTDQGEAFFCCQNTENTEERDVQSTPQQASLLTKMLESDKNETLPFKVQRIPMISRAAKVITDPGSKSFAVLQVDFKEGLKTSPTVTKSMLPAHLKSLFNEAALEDTIHDVEICVKDYVIPAHAFILASRSPAFHKVLLGNRESIPESCCKVIRRIKLEDSNDFCYVMNWLNDLYSCKKVHDKDIFPKSELSKTRRKKGDTEDARRKKYENVLCNLKKCPVRNGDANDSESSDVELVDEMGKSEFLFTDIGDVSVQVSNNIALFQEDFELLTKNKVLSASTKTLSRRSKKGEKEKNKGSLYLQYSNLAEEHCTLDRNDCPELYDVVIEADDGTQLHCHKCVLVARLDYFRSMFCCDWLESDSQTRTLKLPAPSSVLEIILDFLYTGKTLAFKGCEDVELVGNVLVVADQMLIGRLKEICEAQMSNLVSFRNVVELIEFSCVYNADQLKEVCVEYICNNLNVFLESRALDRLSEDMLIEVSKKYRSLIPGMAWRFICPDDLHVPFVQTEEQKTSPSKIKRKHSSGRRKRSSKSESDIEVEVKTSSQEAHIIELENAQEKQCAMKNEIKGDDLERVRDDEQHTNTDLTTSEGSEVDSPRVQSPERVKNEQVGSWYRKGDESLPTTATAGSNKITSYSPIKSSTPPRSQPKSIPSKSLHSTSNESGALSPIKAAWGVSSPPGSSLKDIMEQEEHSTEHHITPGSSKHKSTVISASSPTETASSFVSVKWETKTKQSQKQRKKKSSISETDSDHKPSDDNVHSPKSPDTNVCPWGSLTKQPMSVKSLRDLIEEEKGKETTPSQRTNVASKGVAQEDKTAGAKKKVRAWQTPLTSSPPPSTFSNILQSQEEENTTLDRARKKPLHLIQIEDQAIEELLNQYGGKYNPCEFVTVERMTTAAVTPVWKKERTLSIAST